MKISRETVLQTLKCSPNEYPKLLEEKYPHVLGRIVELWNSHHCAAYFTELLRTDGRSGGRVDRNGFPGKVWDEIFRLNILYRKPRPKPAR